MRRRQAFACSRCYRRKKRCDAKLPACGNCQKVGLNCVSMDRDANVDVPRSLVQYLEQSIAEMEIRMDMANKITLEHPPIQSTDAIPTSIIPNINVRPDNNLHSTFDGNLQAQRILIQPHAIVSGGSLPYEATLISTALLPAPFGQCAVLTEKSDYIRDVMEYRSLSSVPPGVADALMNVYLEKMLPSYPFILEEDVRSSFNSVFCYQPALRPASMEDSFIVLHMMAISVMASRSTENHKLAALADSLHHEAMRNCQHLSITSIRTLQCILLLIQLAFLLPQSGNLHHLVGEAMRMATELGLHQEYHGELRIDPGLINFRRRLFWVTYAMERSVNVTGHRSFAIRDEHIQVAFPQDAGNEIGTDNCDLHATSHFINMVRYRKLQSDICAVQFCNRPFSAESYAEWAAESELKILKWRAEVQSSEGDFSDWFDCGSWYNILLLHRPCLINLRPPAESVKHCFVAAKRIAASYWQTSRHGYLKFPWHGVHNCFEAGTVLLYNVKHYPYIFGPNGEIDIKNVLDVLNHISDIFLLLAERWPSASQCADLFDEIKKDTIRNFFRYINGQSLGESPVLAADRLDFLVLRMRGASQYLLSDSTDDIGSSQSHANCADISLDDIFAGWDIFLPMQDLENFVPIEFAGIDVGFDHNAWSNSTSHASSTPTIHSSHEPEKAPNQAPNQSLSSLESYISKALKQLPTCTYCRQRKSKCDRLLPSCHSCSRANQECKFFDPVLGEETPRAYIHALKTRYDVLMAQSAPIVNGEKQSHDTSPTTVKQLAIMPSPSSRNGHIPLQRNIYYSPSKLIRNKEDVFFFGRTSIFSQLLSAYVDMSLICVDSFHSDHTALDSLLWGSDIPVNPVDMPARQLVEAICENYLHSVELLNPIVGKAIISKAIEDLYSKNKEPSTMLSESSLGLCLVLSITTHCLGMKDSRFCSLSKHMFTRAMSDFTNACSMISKLSFSSLRLMVLLCYLCNLDVSMGSAWRMLGHACRTCMDSDLVSPFMSGGRWDDWSLYMTLFRIECDTAHAYGRPPQITPTEIPTLLIPQPEDTNCISYLLFDLSRLKYRIAISSISSNRYPLAISAWLHDCRCMLSNWSMRWKSSLRMIGRNCSQRFRGNEDLLNFIELYGDFLNYECVLVLHRASPEQVPLNDAHDASSRMIRCFSTIYLRMNSPLPVPTAGSESALPLLLVLPCPWTLIHTLCSAGIFLIHSLDEQYPLSVQQWEDIDLCISILYSLDSDRNQPSSHLATTLNVLLRERKRKGEAETLDFSTTRGSI